MSSISKVAPSAGAEVEENVTSPCWSADSTAPVLSVMRTVTCTKSTSPFTPVGASPSPETSRSLTTKPGTGVVPFSTTVPEPAATVGASFTGMMVSPISRSGGLADAPSEPMLEPVSSNDTVSVTSPSAPALRS